MRQEYSRGGPTLWEASPGQSPQRTALAEEVGVILVKGVITPEVSPQAVDQLPVTGTEPHWTEGAVFCKMDAKYRMSMGRLRPPMLTSSKSYQRGTSSLHRLLPHLGPALKDLTVCGGGL